MSDFTLKKRPEDFPVSEETAKAEVMKIIEFYDYDLETQNEAIRPQIESSLKTLVRAVRQGLLEVKDDDDFQIIQKLKSKPKGGEIGELVYKEFTGAIKRQLDKVPSGENYKRMYSLMGSMAGLPPESFSGMSAADLAVTEALALFFLSK